MSRRWFLCLVCLSVPLFFLARISEARFLISVNEHETRFFFKELAPEISLVVENGASEPTRATIRLELIAPNDKIVAATGREVELKPGRQRIPFALPLKTSDLSPDENTDVLWYRLRYHISQQSNAANATATLGVISLSEITPDVFEIRVVGPSTIVNGRKYQARVLAHHPLTKRPAPGVNIKGAITVDDHDNTTLTSSAITDREGYAELNFDLPARLDANNLELKIEGTRGLVTVSASRTVDIYNQPYILVSTDKPLYQPGQTVHARVLILGPSKRAVANEPVDLEIADPDDTPVFSTSLTTSRFGIASAEWTVPSNIRLGEYELKFSTDDDHSNSMRVKISRYDLPTFTVNVRPDRSYYLPGQNASIQVNAKYLFGKPVLHGRVRLVRETERHWNYREQKYDVTEGDKYEGDVGPDGSFKAQVNLQADHEELQKADYQRFLDLPYAAYFTDASTNRTEQRKFYLRVTREAIHVYVIRSGNNYFDDARMPLRFYVSTFYADGEPAQCKVTIGQTDAESSDTGDVLIRTKTNSYGVAKIDQLRISPATLSASELTMKILVQDKAGRTGKHAETFAFRDYPVIRVSTTKTLYAPREPIAVNINSSETDLPVTVSVIRNFSVIESRVVRLRDRRASLLLNYRPEFKDELTIFAYADVGEESLTSDSRTILYPRSRDLKLTLQSPPSYRPGEQAHVSFEARNPEGRSVESALGVVVVDKAVDERVRTDQEFGAGYTGFYRDILGLLGYENSLGALNRKVLEQVDRSKPIPSDLDLAAEVLLNQNSGYSPDVFGGETYEKSASELFLSGIKKQLSPLRNELTSTYEKIRNYPTNEVSLRRQLTTARIDFDSLKDPWGSNYRPLFLVDGAADVLLLETAGADKQFDTEDDFTVERFSWPYFRPTGEAIDAVVSEFHQRTGGFIRSFDVLRNELKRKGIDADKLLNHWSKPYSFRFEVVGSQFVISVWTTPPPDASTAVYANREFLLWRSNIDYFSKPRWQIDSILTASFKQTKAFPQNHRELADTLRAGGLDLEQIRDPWERPYYSTFKQSSFYGDKVTVESRAAYGQSRSEQIKINPVTKTVSIMTLRSAGPDLRPGTMDDFDVATFSATVSEQSATDLKPQPRVITNFQGASGAITGSIVDPLGAAIPGAEVNATRQNINELFTATSDENGRYLLRNLPAGVYDLSFDRSGFKKAIITGILVRSSELVEVNLTLEVGTVAEVVSVTASSEVSYLNASVTSSVLRSKLVVVAPGLAGAKTQIFTPRLREYFPETLLWQPELTTDKKGRAQLDFKLADNITTWKMSVIGSTEDGEIGTAETEIRAFQPFFAELDPPRVLTEGDQIALPVVLRNYLDKKQSVNLELKPEAWFTSVDPIRKLVEVAEGDSTTQSFNIKAIASINDGKQRVTAIGSDLSDAIEKPVTVHPDGEEKADTSSALLDASTLLTVDLPAETIPNSSHVELKIYPNLLAHVWESVEGIMKRPYGCGEQTISSTYPSLLVLRYSSNKTDSPINEKARRYLQEGYQRLLGYQSDDGGFSYWGHGDSDLALTAYAIRFLSDASSVMQVDSNVISRARTWLISRQRSDGSWGVFHGKQAEDERATSMLTAHVAKSLAMTERGQQAAGIRPATHPLIRALDYLESRSLRIDEPYLIAAYSLASSFANQSARVTSANNRLAALAHRESGYSYWALETNTPFYGWGLAGRIETTALAIQALAETTTPIRDNEVSLRDLQTRGLLFLLRNKDRYGVWYSTQATICVLDAILSVSSKPNMDSVVGVDSDVAVSVNGQPMPSLKMPLDRRMLAPVNLDISSAIKPGKNLIELKRGGSSQVTSVQVVSTYYVPWASARASTTQSVRSGDSESLRLETTFDKTEARVTEEITCHVTAERIGFHGYGMLLAEIGLPPGADVDRASLETAMKASDWSVSQYDVLPDRVVVYLWPRAGGSSFSFKFKPRLSMQAKTAPSVLYDYYNPEARAVIAPGTFTVH